MPVIRGLPLQARDADIMVTRGDDDSVGNNSTINMLIVILAIIVGLLVVLLGILFVLRRMRRQREEAAKPPQYSDVIHESKNHRGHLTIETKDGRSSVILYNNDGKPMLANPNSPPHSPDNIPEIHITFPEEEDSAGRRKSGRVVVVRVGDNAAVGLEPLDEDQLPAYEKESNGSFYSIDMDDIGGLKEKEREDYH